MEPTWQTDGIKLYHGDCREVLPSLAPASFTAAVTDPPYHLTTGKNGGSGPASLNENSPAGRSRISTGFMGKAWDGGDVAMRPETWAEVLRVLKPGAHLLAFGGTRTYHRMACAIEDAGFEIRDCIMWVYGSGFPKSLDVSKAIDKAAGAEREKIAVGDPVKRMIPGADQDATGSWIKDNGRIYQPGIELPATDAAKLWQGYGTALKPALEPIIVARKPLCGTVAANCQEHGCGALNIDGCRIDSEVRPHIEGDRRLMPTASVYCGAKDGSTTGSKQVGEFNLGRWPANIIHDGSEEVLACFPAEAGAAAPVHRRNGDKFRNAYGAFAGNIDEAGGTFHGDSGSAARFFYCAKASRSERGEGNKHPTVKPLALMEYLVKLVTMPSGNRILDPFAGSGTTLLACWNQFVECVGIDLEADHVDISGGRVRSESGKTPLFTEAP